MLTRIGHELLGCIRVKFHAILYPKETVSATLISSWLKNRDAASPRGFSFLQLQLTLREIV